MEKLLYVNETKYKIDSSGIVYSNYTGKWEIMHPIKNQYGYLTFGLTDENGVRKTYFLHRLVYTAFNNLCYAGDFDVHHIDYNKDNCSLVNLKKLSHKENVDDYFNNKFVKTTEDRYCELCGKKLKGGRKLCGECYKKQLISYRILKSDIIDTLTKNNSNFSKSAKEFNMTDNGLRKWCKKYNLPTKSNEWKIT